MRTELEQAAAHINKSKTGAIATMMNDHVSVQVPGLQLLPGGQVVGFYSTEAVRSLLGAIRLVNSMQ